MSDFITSIPIEIIDDLCSKLNPSKVAINEIANKVAYVLTDAAKHCFPNSPRKPHFKYGQALVWSTMSRCAPKLSLCEKKPTKDSEIVKIIRN